MLAESENRADAEIAELFPERPLRVLMVEDMEDDALLVLRALRNGGLDVEHHRVDTQEAFLKALAEDSWDVVLSDYSMPRFDGLTAFELYASSGLEAPFIFVSGRIGEERAVDAMRRGVSDYLQKDNLGRLAPAVRRSLLEVAARRQRREIREALRASEARLQRLAANAPDIIYEYAFTPEPRFGFVSPAATRITGYSPEEHYADSDLWRKIVHPDDLSTLNSLLATGAPSQSGSGHVMRWQHRDGSLRWVEQRTASILDDGGKPIGVEGIVRDITQRKELEAQLLVAQRMEAIGRLAGGIAHDFNNMLTVIGGYCSLLRRKTPEGDPRLRDVSKIEGATERSAALVSQLLAFSRRQPRNVKVLDFNRILSEFEPMLRRVIGEDVQIVMHYGQNLSAVQADRSQIEQILMNLVVNARDAMPDGGRITIETEAVTLDDIVSTRRVRLRPGRYLRFTVTDTGSGMTSEVMNRIFEPFFTTKEVGTGTGLGLATVYGIVKQMEGDVWVYSEIGIGTTFKIYLPSVAAAPSEELADLSPAPLEGSGTILLVEDEKMVREAAEEILAAHGYTIVATGTGPDALGLLESAGLHFDLLLTDLLMPGMNGVELAQQVRKIDPEIRVLYMTGYSEASLPGQCSPNGIACLLQKPFGSQALLQKVGEVIGKANT